MVFTARFIKKLMINVTTPAPYFGCAKYVPKVVKNDLKYLGKILDFVGVASLPFQYG
jgi:hypothetical protein